MKKPPYNACWMAILGFLLVTCSPAIGYNGYGRFGSDHGSDGARSWGSGGRERWISSDRFSGGNRGWVRTGRPFYSGSRFGAGFNGGPVVYPSTGSAESLHAHVITFNRSSDGTVTSFVDADGEHSFHDAAFAGGGRYKFQEWHGGDGGWHRGWRRDRWGFWSCWPFLPYYCGWPYCYAYPFYFGYPYYDYNDEDGFADYDNGNSAGYADAPVTVYDAGGTVPTVVADTPLPAPLQPGYAELGRDWGQDLRREIVNWDQFVQYLRSTILPASPDAREQFRQGFLASYGPNAVAAFDQALRQASGPAIILMPPAAAPSAPS